MLTNQFKFQYSVGAIANGIKTDMFTFFLLFFYSRVIGLDPLLASLAIGAALIVDSITDRLWDAEIDAPIEAPWSFEIVSHPEGVDPSTCVRVLVFEYSNDFKIT